MPLSRGDEWRKPIPKTIDALIVALPESAGSAIYGLVDVFASTGTLWRELVGDEPGRRLIRPKIVSLSHDPFLCGNGIPVRPDLTIKAKSDADIVVVPELWLAPDDDLKQRYAKLKEWLRQRYRAGNTIYSACSGSVLLAASGLLNGKEATSHWGYADLFRRSFPQVRFIPEPNIVFADHTGRIVTAGGATSWHDLAIHIISRHCSPGEALHIAKVYLLQWHGDGQLPYASLVRRQVHADSIVRQAENWLADHFNEPHAVAAVVAAVRYSRTQPEAPVQDRDRIDRHRLCPESSYRGGETAAGNQRQFRRGHRYNRRI